MSVLDRQTMQAKDRQQHKNFENKMSIADRKIMQKQDNIQHKIHDKLNSEKHLKLYYDGINDTCTNVCNSCEGLWFRDSIYTFSVESLLKKMSKKFLHSDQEGDKKCLDFLKSFCEIKNIDESVKLCSNCCKLILNLKVKILILMFFLNGSLKFFFFKGSTNEFFKLLEISGVRYFSEKSFCYRRAINIT